MKKIKLICIIIFIVSCARKVEPTPENINKIFASRDFTFEFNPLNGDKKSISFRNDYLVYKSDKPTYRREISYEEVMLINNFIQNIVHLHSEQLDINTTSYYSIKNTAYKVVIIPDQEDFYFDALLKTLKLDKVK